jgi:hypothetical protein
MKVILRLVWIAVAAFLALGCGPTGRQQPSQTGGSVAGMKRYRYQCWEGGPHILLPNYLRTEWRGYQVSRHPLDPSTDYGRACAVPGDFGLIRVGAGHALILGQSPPMIAWSPESPAGTQNLFILKSWEGLDLDSLLDTVLASADFRSTGLQWTIPEPGAALYFAGDDLEKPVAGRLDVPVPAGTYNLLSSKYADVRKGEVVAIRLTLQEPP